MALCTGLSYPEQIPERGHCSGQARPRGVHSSDHPPAAGSNPGGGHTILGRRVVPSRSLGDLGWALWMRGSLPSLKHSTRSHPPALASASAPATVDRAFTGGAEAAAVRTAPPACRQRPGIPTGGKRMPCAAAWRFVAGAPRRVRSLWPPPVAKLFRPETRAVGRHAAHGSYLVDSASSHMLVSKIKPCMSKYKQLYSETANGSLNQLSFI